MGASAYLIYLPRMNKVITSSAVIFDDIPTEVPFLSDRPDHWISPAPGVDDAAPVMAEELAAETACDGMPEDQPRRSAFDGRDIPRPRRGPETTGNRQRVEDTEAVEIKAEEEEAEPEDQPEARRSTRTRVQFNPQRMPSGTREIEELNRLIAEDSDEEENHFTYCMLADVGLTMEEAMAGPESEEWRDAIAKEDQGLEENGVLVKEDCPDGIKPLKTRYVLTKKLAPDGTVKKFKARRVVQGFSQVYGRDFMETFAPVIGFDTLRILINLWVENGWLMWALDFTQAYLNAPLKEAIWIRNPDGTSSRLNRALYGLKQGGLEWNKTLSSHITQRTPWKRSEFDNCLFFAQNEKTGKIGIIAVYVDDILMTGSWEDEVQSLKEHLLSKFKGRVDMDPEMFLGLEIERRGDDRILHQT